MQSTRLRVTATVAVLAALAGASISAARAAEPAPRTRPASEVFAQLGQSAGVIVMADSTVLGRLPLAAATPETVERQIVELVRALPPGTTWVKLYLPTPANGRWTGDVVADYARAQARLLGTTIGRPTPAGTVEILGRQIPADRASEHITALHLKLVYLITNPQAQTAVTGAGWEQMAPEQRDAYARQQAQRILGLDPASRMAMLHQMMQRDDPRQAILHRVMEGMTDGERVQLKQSLVEEGKARGKFISDK